MGLDIKTLAAAKKYAKELAKDAGAIAVDTSMSDISKNPVQNKVIKKYVDDRTITISKKEGNTLSLEDDGLYNPEITDQNKKDIADKILKDMEKGLVAGYIMFGNVNKNSGQINCQTAYNICKLLNENIVTNITEDEYSLTDGWIQLRAGKTYELISNIAISYVNPCTINSRFINYDTKAAIATSNPTYDTATNYRHQNIDIIYTPEEDVRICLSTIATTAYNANYYILGYASSIVIKELNQYESPIMKQAELDSCFCKPDTNWTAVANQKLPIIKISGNMEVADHAIKVKPGERIQLSVCMNYQGLEHLSNTQWSIKDITNNINITAFQPYRADNNSELAYCQTCQYTNETDADCWIAIICLTVYVSTKVLKNYTTISVQEIGKALILENDTNSAITEISKEENNAIIEKEDGIFVQSHTENITEIQNRIADVKKYQRYVNTELDSCFCGLDNTVSVIEGQIIPFVKKSGNMEVFDGKVKVKSGKRVQINIVIGYYGNNTAGNIAYNIIDETNDIIIAGMSPYRGDLMSEYAYTQTCQYTNETDKDCWIGLKVNKIYTNDNLRSIMTTLSVQEIGHEIVIDPVEHVDTTKGIEDTPVGHIISYMGNNPPKHYLNCDGAVYNISDYPYLAEHIKTEFGIYEHFGGDGTTTFAVPDLRGEFLRGTGKSKYDNQGTGPNVGEHRDSTIISNTWFGDNHVEIYDKDTTDDNLITNFDWYETGNRRMRVNGTIQSYASSAGYGTIRPTNTSVLYCIKYEPTYFMKFEGKDRYSTEETIIGEWIDGKPIYRKIITKDYDITNTAASNDFLFDISSLDAELIIKNYGTVSATGNSGNTSNLPLPYQMQGQQTLASWISITAQKLYIRNCLGTTYPKVILNYLAIEYIKTND